MLSVTQLKATTGVMLCALDLYSVSYSVQHTERGAAVIVIIIVSQ